MLIDAHHHFWKYTKSEYAWISDEMNVIQRDFLPVDLESEIKRNSVNGVVTVQVQQNLQENDWMLQLADKHSFVKGVVGWVDLQSLDVENELKKYSANNKFVGIRHIVQAEEDDRFMLRKDFLRGISLLEKYNLTYDILVFPKHLPIAVEMVRQFPNQKFVLDHIAKPFIKAGTIEPWKSDIEKLASFKNVYCKISGMVTEADWNESALEKFYPYMEVVHNAFGSDRLMLGSDWPVCLVAANYDEVFNIPRTFISHLPHDEQEKITARNCVRFYGLSV